MISEPLNVAGHQNYPAGTAHGYAASIGGNIGSFHHNLIAHAEGRSWSMAGGLDGANVFAGRLDIRNNVVYNFGSRVTDGGAHQVNFVSNFYKPGPASSSGPKYDLQGTVSLISLNFLRKLYSYIVHSTKITSVARKHTTVPVIRCPVYLTNHPHSLKMMALPDLQSRAMRASPLARHQHTKSSLVVSKFIHFSLHDNGMYYLANSAGSLIRK